MAVYLPGSLATSPHPDLGDRGKSRAAEAEPEVAHQVFYKSLELEILHDCCGMHRRTLDVIPSN
jgi:hypothetical protein